MTLAWGIRPGTRPNGYRDGQTLYVDHENQRAWIRQGTATWRNNNPGAIMYDIWMRSGLSRTYTPIGRDCNGNAIFEDYETGRAALLALLRTNSYNRQNFTLSDAIARYTGHAAGTVRHRSYLNSVVNYLNDNSSDQPPVSAESQMTELMNNRPGDLASAIENTERFESGPIGVEEVDYETAFLYCETSAENLAGCMPCDAVADSWMQEAFEMFEAELRPDQRTDPAVIDLDGNGPLTTSVENGPHVDHEGNGFAERTGWVSSGDGLLVFDGNGDGIVSTPEELLGDQTMLRSGRKASSSFEAVSDLDDNLDGRIDTNDKRFSQIRVWKDEDGNGYSHSGELYRLDELGISAINLDATADFLVDPQGNTQNRVWSFERADGTSGQIAEFSFRTNNMDTIAEEFLRIPEELWELPNLRGYGNVYELKQAMVRDTTGELISLTEQFIAAADPGVRRSLMHQILFKRTQSENVEPGSRGRNIDGRKVAVLEKLFGQSFSGVDGPQPTYWESIALEESYRLVYEGMYARLMAQTHLKDLYEAITYRWNGENDDYEIETSGLIAALDEAIANDPERGKQLLSEFARTRRAVGFHDENCFLSLREHFIQQDPGLGWVFDTGGLQVIDDVGKGWPPWSRHIMGTDKAEAVKGDLSNGDGWLNSRMGEDVIYGTSRNEGLVNDLGDAVLVAGGGSDRIYAGRGNDVLDGGTGNDTLRGERGNDTYIFRRGSGQDVIIDPDPTEGNTDTIWLGSSLTPEEIVLRRSGNNLVLKIFGTNDALTVKDYFRNNSTLNRVERIQFMDGTVWSHEEIIEAAYSPSEGADLIYGDDQDNVISALGGDDRVYGLSGGDTLRGDSGADQLYGQDGTDSLYGGEGADTLQGGSGADVLDGGAGDDALYGGSKKAQWWYADNDNGNDTYRFGRGAGHDTILDRDTATGNLDTILLADDIAVDDVLVKHIGEDLLLTIMDTGDTLTVTTWVQNHTPITGVASTVFADGTVLDIAA